MPIPVVCAGCGKRFKAPDKGAGKKVPCPACRATIAIPELLRPEEDDDYRLEDLPPPPPAVKIPTPPPPQPAVKPKPAPTKQQLAQQAAETLAASGSPAAKAWVPPTKSSTPNWLRHLHWCLALAMIPLAISVVVPDSTEVSDAAEASPDSAAAADSPGEPPASEPPADSTEPPTSEDTELTPQEQEILEDMDPDDLLRLLPGNKLPGAFLARDSYLHWLFALIAVAAFLTFLVFLASDKSAQPLHLVGLGFFTATGGILLLLVVQALAGLGIIRARGVVGLILLILALIGLSYTMALHPDTGFVLSFIGFTCGVGFCEELCKALPILVYYRIGNEQSWRGAFLWGLASGVGFGVSEGIMYSGSYYNGIAGPGIYVVRFVSCVALHAIWAGSVGISINQRKYLLQEDTEEWWQYVLAVLWMISVPMVLHGLYDTLLKKEMELLALVTAAASFGYLAWQISRLRGSDDEDERAAYVASYIRGKAGAGA